MGDGGEDHLAPVIPLFGGRGSDHASSGSTRDDRRAADDRDPAPSEPTRFAAGAWRVREGNEPQADEVGSPSPSHPSLASGRRSSAPPRLRALGASSEQGPDADELAGGEVDAAQRRERAEEALVRRLRSRQLSVSEARAVLRENDLDRDAADEVVDDFERRGYLDDRTLASLLVTSGVERRGQGRVALSRALSQRGIPREVIDAALAELPDDDAERALEFARSKAPGMSRLEPDTALRRLLGQLARRGYGGSVAMNAARTALREAGAATRSGVRFTESD